MVQRVTSNKWNIEYILIGGDHDLSVVVAPGRGRERGEQELKTQDMVSQIIKSNGYTVCEDAVERGGRLSGLGFMLSLEIIR